MTVDVGFSGQPFIEEMLDKIAEAKNFVKKMDIIIRFRLMDLVIQKHSNA